MKLQAGIDEYYLSQVRTGQTATIDLDGRPTTVTVKRISPQVHSGQFSVDLDFEGASPPELVSGKALQGSLQLGDDRPATIIPAGPFLERSGGNFAFVVAKDGRSAARRPIKVGRRTAEQLEIVAGLTVGERLITSDYTSFDQVDRIVFTH